MKYVTVNCLLADKRLNDINIMLALDLIKALVLQPFNRVMQAYAQTGNTLTILVYKDINNITFMYF